MPSRILIIDGAPANIQTLSSILKELGYCERRQSLCDHRN
jgi:hypothetical protein